MTPFRLCLGSFSLWALLPGSVSAQQDGQSRLEEAIDLRRQRLETLVGESGFTGDWFGAGAWLQERGIRFEAAVTGFYQDLWAGSGGLASAVGGKLDGLLRMDLHALGLWQGLSLTAHPECNLGESVNGIGGTLLPVNVAMQLPGATGRDRFDFSSIFLTQKFGDTATLIVGKTNLADVTALHPYAGGTGIIGFMNGGLASAPNGAIPPYVFGGLLVVKRKNLVYSLGLYGGTNARGSFDFAEAFDQGCLVSAGVTVPVKPWGQPGQQSFSVIWGDRDSTSLQGLGDIIPPAGIENLAGLESERLLLRYAFHQQLGAWHGDPDRGWGLWARGNLADDKLTAVAWSLAGGVGGHSPLPGRKNDRWGFGLFWYSFADYLGDTAYIAIPLKEERGLECFYNAELTPWLHLTADLQVIDPAVPGMDRVIVGGLRLVARF